MEPLGVGRVRDQAIRGRQCIISIITAVEVEVVAVERHWRPVAVHVMEVVCCRLVVRRLCLERERLRSVLEAIPRQTASFVLSV